MIWHSLWVIKLGHVALEVTLASPMEVRMGNRPATLHRAHQTAWRRPCEIPVPKSPAGRLRSPPGATPVLAGRQDRARLYLEILYALSVLQRVGDKHGPFFLPLDEHFLKVRFSTLGSQDPLRGLESQNYLYNDIEMLFALLTVLIFVWILQKQWWVKLLPA